MSREVTAGSLGARSRQGKYHGRQYGLNEGERAQAAEKARRGKAAVACKVFGCTNTSHDAKFIGIMCSPCWDFLMTGVVTRAAYGSQEATTPEARKRLREVRAAVGMGATMGAGDV